MYTYDQQSLFSGSSIGANSSTISSSGNSSSNDMKRLYNELHSSGKYKCVHSFDHCQINTDGGNKRSPSHITTFNCMNSILSPILLTATSDKRLCILDANVGRMVLSLQSSNPYMASDIAASVGFHSQSGEFPHDRAVHHIALPVPSVHTTTAFSPQETYNMFATAAMDNLVALYDIRTPHACIARYVNHINRREPIKCCFSPCLRYLATGSEDRSIRIVDIRGSFREVAKISSVHTDVTCDVAFSPLFPQLASASYDGTVKFFMES